VVLATATVLVRWMQRRFVAPWATRWSRVLPYTSPCGSQYHAQFGPWSRMMSWKMDSAVRRGVPTAYGTSRIRGW
jgi:hypothetical protein